jgi:hypothetical protein
VWTLKEIIYATGRDITEKVKLEKNFMQQIKRTTKTRRKVEEESDYKFKIILKMPDGIFVLMKQICRSK